MCRTALRDSIERRPASVQGFDAPKWHDNTLESIFLVAYVSKAHKLDHLYILKSMHMLRLHSLTPGWVKVSYLTNFGCCF